MQTGQTRVQGSCCTDDKTKVTCSQTWFRGAKRERELLSPPQDVHLSHQLPTAKTGRAFAAH